MGAERATPIAARLGAKARLFLGRRYAATAKVLFVVILLVWPLVFPSQYAMSVMTTAGFYAILTIGVGIIVGQAGQLSFAHPAFYGMGAYIAGLLAAKTSLPTLVALVIGTMIPGIIAFIIGRPVLKLRYFYLVLATMGLGQIFIVVVSQLRSLTGGLNGFIGVPSLSIFGFSVWNFIRQYYVVWIVTIVLLLFFQRALKHRFGRTLRALATSEIASATLGIRVPNWKLLAFVVSAMVCGISGGLFAFVTGTVSPTSFTFNAGVLPMVMMILGGGTTIWGGIVGAIFMTWLINASTSLQAYSGVAYTVILILLIMFLPMGVLGLRPAESAWLRRVLKKESPRETTESPNERNLDLDSDTDETDPPPSLPAAESFGSGLLQEELARAQSEDWVEGPLLSIEDVSVTFGGLRAVDSVSFEVVEGSITALIGPNGAGKTTLFNAISRQQDLSGGRIELCGTDLRKLGPADAARLGLARTFQNLRIFFNMTVLENVLVGGHRHERSGLWSSALGWPSQRAEEHRSLARAMDALALVGLEEHASAPATSLPYGQQRLVEIARALTSQPRLLLLDEPAAGMNASERADLVRRIAMIRAAGITVLIVEHDVGLVMNLADTVNVLDYGKLIASGPPAVVKADQAVVHAYLGSDAEQGKDRRSGRETADRETRPASEEMLVLNDVVTRYGSIEALHGVSLTVSKGEAVAVLGANGAGKTTLLRTVSGILRPTGGSISYLGSDITTILAEKIVMRGLCQVPEGRHLFPTLSVEDNLVIGASGRRERRTGLADDIAYVYDLFPILGERHRQLAKTLSGGEQQMLAIGRALMGRPSLLLLDEPSMGLAPKAVERIFDALARLNADGLTMLMVEQNAQMALSLASRVAVLQTGSVVLTGTASDLRDDDRLRVAYLGERREQESRAGRNQ